jgi:REP element-mobilizing transposase RayT
LFEHIRENCRQKNIYLDIIGGWSEHIHILLSLAREQSIAKVMMLIKGESAHWINKQDIFRGKFFWQDDYLAVSVSESKLAELRAYIEKQEEHHKAVPFDRELKQLENIVQGKLG